MAVTHLNDIEPEYLNTVLIEPEYRTKPQVTWAVRAAIIRQTSPALVRTLRGLVRAIIKRCSQRYIYI